MIDSLLIIPTFDPIPLPAPVWLLKGLLLLTLLLHLIAMNLLLGGAWTVFWCAIRSKYQPTSHNGRLFREMLAYLPTLTAMTVTLGVAPLLFVQVLYGHLVYTSSIAMGWFWWLVFPLVIIAYYSFYYLKFHQGGETAIKRWLPLLAALILLWISFILSNNFNLAQQPERFSKIILEDPSGWSLNLGDPTTFPRWLHMVIGAIAVCGIWVMWLGRIEHKKDVEYAMFKMEFGYKLFALPTMINILVGFIFMMSLPRNIMMRLMGKSMLETMLWLVGMGLAIWAIPVLKRATTEPQSSALPLGTILVGITICAMVLLRDMVRSAYQEGFYTLDMPKVDTMWGAIAMFFVTFVIGLWLLRWLVQTYLKGSKT